MKSVNKVILLGNVGKDPESDTTSGGTMLTKFSLATTERYKDKSDVWQDKTTWHNIVAWRKLAEIVGPYIKKGSRLYIEGKIQVSSWDDKKTGEKKYKTEIVADEIVLLDNKGSERPPVAAPQEKEQDNPDIPF